MNRLSLLLAAYVVVQSTSVERSTYGVQSAEAPGVILQYCWEDKEYCEDLAEALNQAHERRRCEKQREAHFKYWDPSKSGYSNGIIPPFTCRDDK